MRWIFHVVLAEAFRASMHEDPYGTALVGREGFIHGSYRDTVLESARLYFAEGAELLVLQIDPRGLDVPVDVAATPRGPMPHVRGAIRRSAIAAVLDLSAVARAPDVISEGEAR